MGRRHRSLLRLVALFSVITLLGAACTSDDDTKETTTTAASTARGGDDTLTIATLLPTTGQLATFGPGMIKAVEYAVDEINTAGGALGNDVKLEANADSATDPDTAGQAADTLLSNADLDIIIGAAASGVSSAIVDKIGGDGVGQCSPSNTAADLSGPLYWRTAPSDDLQGPALAEFIAEGGHGTVAILARADDYGKGLAGSVKDALEASGIDVVADVSYDPEGSDFSADVGEIAAASPDAIVLIAFPEEGAKVMSTMIANSIGPADVPVFTADGLQSDEFGAEVDASNPSVINGLQGTAPSGGGSDEFSAAFATFAPDEAGGPFTAQSYDCIIATALAAESAKSDDPKKIKAELPKITTEGEKCTDYATCSTAIAAGTDIDYDGASGPLEFQTSGNPGIGNYETWRYEDGEIITISTLTIGSTSG